MPAGQGKDAQQFDQGQFGTGPLDSQRLAAERFATAVEQGRSLGSIDADLRDELDIVAMLRSQGAAYSPDPDAKARAKQRLMAVLAAEPAALPTITGAPTAMEQTAPIGRLPAMAPEIPAVHPVGAAEVTVQMAAVADTSLDELPYAAPETLAEPLAVEGPTPVPTSARPGRRGRHTKPSRPAAGPRRARSAPHGMRRRVVLVGSAALVALIALAGTGVFVSRDALPGDSLYALKRASESAGLALTFDEQAKGLRHLQLASTRLGEVEQMVARQAQTPADADLLQSTMREFDLATGEGARLLLAADDAGGTAALGDLRAWAVEQVARLSVVRSALPLPAMAGADDSIELLDRLLGRAGALEERSDCTEVTSGVTDDLGRMPAEGACTPRPVEPADRTGTGDPADATRGSGSTDPSGPATPGGSVAPGPGTPPDDQSPGLDPALPSTGVGTGSNTTTPPAAPGDNLSIPVPLPLLPPISLPPLGPGLPGVTIG